MILMTTLPARISASWPPEIWKGVHVVVAVSGGADSVALLRSLEALKQQHGGSGQLIVAHLNHRLRADASDADQQWVEALAQRLGLPLRSRAIDTRRVARADGDGIEAAARKVRLAFLREAAEATGARYVATAHTADDQIETVLFRVFRGTGIAGLGGIRPYRKLAPSVTLVRPLLAVSRGEILQYLADLGQTHVEDATNRDVSFSRNWIRHRLLPDLEVTLGRDVRTAVMELAEQAAAVQSIVDSRVDELIDAAVSHDTRQMRINRQSLSQVGGYLAAEVCRRVWRNAGWPEQDMTHHHWQQLATMLNSEIVRARTMPGNVQVRVEGDTLVLSEPRPAPPSGAGGDPS